MDHKQLQNTKYILTDFYLVLRDVIFNEHIYLDFQVHRQLKHFYLQGDLLQI